MDDAEFARKYRELLAARGGPAVRGRDYVGPASAPRSDGDMRARRRDRARREAEKAKANREAGQARSQRMRRQQEQGQQRARASSAGSSAAGSAGRRARVPAEPSKMVWTLLAELLGQDSQLSARVASSVAHRCRALHREFVASLSLEDIDDLSRDVFLSSPGE